MGNIENKIINIKCKGNKLIRAGEIATELKNYALQGDSLNINGEYKGIVLFDKKPLIISQTDKGIKLKHYGSLEEEIITKEETPELYQDFYKIFIKYK